MGSTFSFDRFTVAFAVLGALVAGSPSWAQAADDAAEGKLPAIGSPFANGTNAEAKPGDAWYSDYRFRNGQTLAKMRIHYVTLGSPHRNEKGEIDNAVLMLHWTGADGRTLTSPSFTQALYGPGRPLDSRRYFIIVPDNVGHGQSTKPSDGYRASFPSYTYDDIVDIQRKLVVETLGIKRLRAIVGLSMGGMNAWQWAEAYPDAMDGVMPIVAFPMAVSGRNLLWRQMVIRQVQSDPEWKGGNYAKPPQSWAQAYGVLRLMIDGVPHLQSAIPNVGAANRFIDAVQQQASSLDPNDALFSIKSSFNYDPEPSLSIIKTKVFALNFADDEFNPDSLQVLQRLVPRVPHAEYVVQAGSEKSFGHLTMAHPELWADQVSRFMKSLD